MGSHVNTWVLCDGSVTVKHPKRNYFCISDQYIFFSFFFISTYIFSFKQDMVINLKLVTKRLCNIQIMKQKTLNRGHNIYMEKHASYFYTLVHIVV